MPARNNEMQPRKHEDTKTTNFFRAFVLSWSPLFLCLVSLSAQTPATNWSQFRGDPRLTGVTTSVPPAALTVRWTYDAGDAIESSAAIVDGGVYVGSSKGELLALDLETGALRWKYATGDSGFIGESSPAVSAASPPVASCFSQIRDFPSRRDPNAIERPSGETAGASS